jgi:RNA polymerase sigma-70 factor, ECF subfamily
MEKKRHEINLQEQALIQKAAQGDHQAFEVLLRRYESRIMALIRSFTKNRADASDLFQEVFLRAWQGLSRFRHEASFYTWVYRITVNRCITWLDTRGRRERLHNEPWDDEVDGESWLERTISQHAASTPASHGDRKDRHENLQKIWRAVETLNPKQRLIFCLRFQHGLHVKEISEIMDMPDGTVKILTFRAVRAIRKEMKIETTP